MQRKGFVSPQNHFTLDVLTFKWIPKSIILHSIHTYTHTNACIAGKNGIISKKTKSIKDIKSQKKDHQRNKLIIIIMTASKKSVHWCTLALFYDYYYDGLVVVSPFCNYSVIVSERDECRAYKVLWVFIYAEAGFLLHHHVDYVMMMPMLLVLLVLLLFNC